VQSLESVPAVAKGRQFISGIIYKEQTIVQDARNRTGKRPDRFTGLCYKSFSFLFRQKFSKVAKQKVSQQNF
jgi:hypothetical protein